MHQAQVANVNVAKAAAFGDSPEMAKKGKHGKNPEVSAGKASR